MTVSNNRLAEIAAFQPLDWGVTHMELVEMARELQSLRAAAKVRAIREGDGEVRVAALNEAAIVAAQFIDGRLYKPKFPACSYHAGEIADAIRALAATPAATGGGKE